MQEQLLTLRQTAQRLNTTYDRAAFLARSGLLPVVRMGRLVRVDPEALQEWIRNGGQAYEGSLRKQAVAN